MPSGKLTVSIVWHLGAIISPHPLRAWGCVIFCFQHKGQEACVAKAEEMNYAWQLFLTQLWGKLRPELLQFVPCQHSDGRGKEAICSIFGNMQLSRNHLV